MRIERRLVIVIVLLVAAALSWWWSQDNDMPRSGATPSGENDFDYSFTGLEVSEAGPNGDIVHTLSADALSHYPAQQNSVLTEPRLAFYDQGAKTWAIAAHSGVVTESDRSVMLSGEVRVDYAGTAPDQGFELTTEALHVWPDDRRAETDQAVRVVQSTGVVDSIGMKADLNTRQLFLLSQVHGVYEP